MGGSGILTFHASFIVSIVRWLSSHFCNTDTYTIKVVLTRVLGPLNFFLMSEKQQVKSGMTFDFWLPNNHLRDLLNCFYTCMPTNTTTW